MRENIYVDFEMNKYKEGPSEIIAIGAVKVLDGIVTDRFYSLVALERSDEVCVQVSILTGITNFDMQKAKPFAEVWANFKDWVGACNTYCWGDFDKASLLYTWRVQRNPDSKHKTLDVTNFVHKMVDLESTYGYDKIYHKQSLKDIVLSINPEYPINLRSLHNPTYDAQLLSEFHRLKIKA